MRKSAPKGTTPIAGVVKMTPSQQPKTSNIDKSQRTNTFFCVLILLLGGMSWLRTLSIEGGHVRLGLSSMMMGAMSDSKDIREAQYSATTSQPSRLFRRNDDESYSGSANKRHPTTLTPYERRWPGYRLPWWAQKVRRFRNFQPPAGKSVCFVHVGKTAGSSIGCALGFRLHCEGPKQYVAGRLPKLTAHAFHKDVYDCPANTDYFLFVVRDPLERMRSAFVYGRPDERGQTTEPKNWEKIRQIYNDCPFSTASSLAALGLDENGEASDDCKVGAKEMLRGIVRYEDHIFFNYQYYWESIPHKRSRRRRRGAGGAAYNSNVLIIRTEHMHEDWNKIELGFGGRQRQNITFPHVNSRPKENSDIVLEDKARILLCNELCAEIQTYKLMLRKALNIGEQQYNASMKELESSCPKEAKLKQCDFHTPNIKKKLHAYRGPTS